VRKFALVALLTIAAGNAAAAARADFVYGEVTVSRLDGREQPLARGAELGTGDTVRTARGRAQLRFSDGAYVSLQPNSEFAIRDYRFDGKTDGDERGFFALAKGAMRTISGLIGRANRDRYQITTPTATIGIRGTGGVIQVRDDGSTLVVGTSGIWSLTNASGSMDVPAGVSGLAPAAPDAPPQRSSEAPQAGPAPLILPAAYVQGEQRDAEGNLTGITNATLQVPPPAESSVSDLGVVFTYAIGAANPFPGLGFDTTGGVTGAFNASGQLVRADSGGSLYRLEPGGTHADFGTDGILTWGRWMGPVMLPTGPENYSPNQGFHYVVGMPTPVLPTNIVNASYVLSGASSPTYLDGSQSPGVFTGSLNVTFGAQATIDTVNWRVTMPDATFIIQNTQMSTRSSSFSTALVPTQGCVNAGCTTDINGFFAGPTAERAGAAYTIDDAKRVIGAAAFSRQP
jgi:FecR protein